MRDLVFLQWCFSRLKNVMEYYIMSVRKCRKLLIKSHRVMSRTLEPVRLVYLLLWVRLSFEIPFRHTVKGF
jgi:hypothetical protein